MVKPQTSDIRMTYEYIQVTYASVCHSYVLVCHPCVTRMYSYIISLLFYHEKKVHGKTTDE